MPLLLSTSSWRSACAATLVAAAVAVHAQAPAAPESAGRKNDKDQLLSAEQVGALLAEWTDDKPGVKLQFQASFGVRTVSPQEKRHYVKSGKIPARLTCELYEVKTVRERKLLRRMGGTAQFYILDSDGVVIARKSLALDKMCPS